MSLVCFFDKALSSSSSSSCSLIALHSPDASWSPSSPATIDVRLSNREVEEQVCLMVAALSPVVREHCNPLVCVHAPPSVSYVVSVLAVMRCGAAFVPLDEAAQAHVAHSVIKAVAPVAVIVQKLLFSQVRASTFFPYVFLMRLFSSCCLFYGGSM